MNTLFAQVLRHRLFRRFLLRLHLFTALSVGVFFVILGLTGSANVFMTELEELGLPRVNAHNTAKRCSLEHVIQTLKQAHPNRKARWTLSLPGHDRAYIWANYAKPIETADEFYAPLRVLIDPYSGAIVAQHFWGETLWSLVYEVHADLLLGKLGPESGKVGFKIVSFLGLLLLLSSFSGLYLWWPAAGKFKQAVRIKRKASAQRLTIDSHRVAGFYSSFVLIIIAFSGFSFAYNDSVTSLVASFSEIHADHHKEPNNLSSFNSTVGQRISVDQATAIADKVFPEANLRWLAMPDGEAGVFAIEKRQAGEVNHRRPRSKVWIDQYTGEVLKIENPAQFSAGETFLNSLWPLHSGEALGLIGRIIWCITGFMPLLLYSTGLMRWLQKRRAGRHKRLKQTLAQLSKPGEASSKP